MPDMGSDESTSIEGDDWKDFDMDIVTDQGNIQAKGGGGFDKTKVTRLPGLNTRTRTMPYHSDGIGEI